MEYLKSSGRNELEDFVQTLREQISDLKKKHIRERKKTWLYKAKNAKRNTATGSNINIRRSAARVSPEVDEGVETRDSEVSLSETSPRQSSLSVFSEIRRKRSAQVHPAEECAFDEQDQGNSVMERRDSVESQAP